MSLYQNPPGYDAPRNWTPLLIYVFPTNASSGSEWCANAMGTSKTLHGRYDACHDLYHALISNGWLEDGERGFDIIDVDSYEHYLRLMRDYGS